MPFIRTMLGDIKPEQLGFTYSHEHIVCRPRYWIEHNQDDLLLDDPEKSCREVELFRQAGGVSIVDATAIDYGRDPAAVRDISKATGVQIIGTAGFNKGFLWNAKMPGEERTYKEWIDSATEDELTQFIIDEVEVGMQGTGVRAGQVKFGTGYNSISRWKSRPSAPPAAPIWRRARRCIRTRRRVRWALNSSSISEKRASIRIT